MIKSDVPDAMWHQLSFSRFREVMGLKIANQASDRFVDPTLFSPFRVIPRSLNAPQPRPFRNQDPGLRHPTWGAQELVSSSDFRDDGPPPLDHFVPPFRFSAFGFLSAFGAFDLRPSAPIRGHPRLSAPKKVQHPPPVTQ